VTNPGVELAGRKSAAVLVAVDLPAARAGLVEELRRRSWEAARARGKESMARRWAMEEFVGTLALMLGIEADSFDTVLDPID